MKRMIKVGNAQGFWGDSPQAPLQLLKQAPDLDYLTLEYLAEISMSIMAVQKEKDPLAGYARDFLEVIQNFIPFWRKGSKCRIITNAGGLNPLGCADACIQILKKENISLRIGVVTGDDVTEIVRKTPGSFKNMDTGEDIEEIREKIVTANAYLEAAEIAQALEQKADIVITGRVADPSLTLAPCLFEWKWKDYDHIAGGTIAGHLIECGTQVTGGFTTNWLQLPDPIHIGFPIAEIAEDGSCIITKPDHTGGMVSVQTVKEQLVYEIGDPDAYLSPDVTASFLSIQLKEEGENRVRVYGATGHPPPNTLKVSVTYRAGFKSEAMLGIYGFDIKQKAHLCKEVILEKIKQTGHELDQLHLECIGAGDIVPGTAEPICTPSECVMRFTAISKNPEPLICFSQEIASLITCGPQGITGYTTGRPKIRPLFGFWPCLIDRNLVSAHVEVIGI